MSTLPVSLLNLLGATQSGGKAGDSDKEPADGFQALLDIGSKPSGSESRAQQKALPVQEKDGRDAVASLVDSPATKTDDLPPPKQETHDGKVDVKEAPERAQDDRAPVAAKDKPADKSASDTEKTAGQTDKRTDAPAKTEESNTVRPADEQTESDSPKITLRQIRERLEAVLAALLSRLEGGQASGQVQATTQLQVTLSSIASLQSLNVDNLPIDELPQDVLARLQSVLQTLQQFLQSDAKLPELARQGLPPLFGQLVASFKQAGQATDNTQPLSQILGKLEQLVQEFTATAKNTVTVLPTQADGSQNKEQQSLLQVANDNKPAVQAGAEKAAPAVAVQAHVKPDAANNIMQATVSGAAVIDTASGRFSGTSTGSGQQDNSALAFGLTRTATPAQANAAAPTNFSRLMQQTQQPVVEQIIFHIKTMPQNGSSKIHIQLHPAELGKLDIKMDVDSDGKAGITITADNKNTLDLLQKDARGLERALADAGIKADAGNLNFSLRGEQQDGQQEQLKAAMNYQQAAPEEEPLPTDILTRSYVVDLAEGLDIKI